MPSATTTRMPRPGRKASKRAFNIGTASSAVIGGEVGLVGRRGEARHHLVEVASQPQVGGAPIGRQAGRSTVQLHRVVVEVLGAHRQQHAGGGGQRPRGLAQETFDLVVAGQPRLQGPQPFQGRRHLGRRCDTRAGAARGRRRRRTPSPGPASRQSSAGCGWVAGRRGSPRRPRASGSPATQRWPMFEMPSVIAPPPPGSPAGPSR